MKPPIERIGGRIRALRKKQALTLEDLSQSTGLSKGLLSQVERGISQPSLETLWKITRALDTSIVHLFEEESHTHVYVTRREERDKVTFADSTGACYVLGYNDYTRLRMLEIILKPGETMRDPFTGGEGEQGLVVTKGNLTAQIGTEEFELREGDSAFFNNNLAHSVMNNTDETVTYLWSITPFKAY
ncbi:hypothetical protein BEP19_06680 [Ammoniphilus oxalaticus]|uniref:HTH cro/C1-type domain-containing protein n=1 Tax=Ammoniphilus oxalaticus TaxID=66863 RepID=A0A419SJL8_9BACL|nr:XRE family transcriptional regulator [Ammoniphilus oxalaticus]RKD24088.1 hypothetical protein BEP19_06680 [Ammoniphilus oxalaticus]